MVIKLSTYQRTPWLCWFIGSSFVCHKLEFSLYSLIVPLYLALPFCAVAGEAGRMRRLATDEGHGEKPGMALEQSPLIERFCDKYDPRPILRPNQFANQRISEYNTSHFSAFLHYLIWQGRDISCLDSIGWPLPLCLRASF